MDYFKNSNPSLTRKLNMIESRCGILCGPCKYREKMSCSGCIAIRKAFWGEACPVKSCCEGKNHSHCGQCSDFPCALLNQFATRPSASKPCPGPGPVDPGRMFLCSRKSGRPKALSTPWPGGLRPTGLSP